MRILQNSFLRFHKFPTLFAEVILCEKKFHENLFQTLNFLTYLFFLQYNICLALFANTEYLHYSERKITLVPAVNISLALSSFY